MKRYSILFAALAANFVGCKSEVNSQVHASEAAAPPIADKADEAAKCGVAPVKAKDMATYFTDNFDTIYDKTNPKAANNEDVGKDRTIGYTLRHLIHLNSHNIAGSPSIADAMQIFVENMRMLQLRNAPAQEAASQGGVEMLFAESPDSSSNLLSRIAFNSNDNHMYFTLFVANPPLAIANILPQIVPESVKASFPNPAYKVPMGDVVKFIEDMQSKNVQFAAVPAKAVTQ